MNLVVPLYSSLTASLRLMRAGIIHLMADGQIVESGRHYQLLRGDH